MGYYINPLGGNRESWLEKNGTQVSRETAAEHGAGENGQYVVCLIDNGGMVAAGIAYDNRERDVFALDDGRPKKWYLVMRDALKPYCALMQ